MTAKKCERVRGQKADVAKKMQIKSTIRLEDTAVNREINRRGERERER